MRIIRYSSVWAIVNAHTVGESSAAPSGLVECLVGWTTKSQLAVQGHNGDDEYDHWGGDAAGFAALGHLQSSRETIAGALSYLSKGGMDKSVNQVMTDAGGCDQLLTSLDAYINTTAPSKYLDTDQPFEDDEDDWEGFGDIETL